jgi:hypothetical protein
MDRGESGKTAVPANSVGGMVAELPGTTDSAKLEMVAETPPLRVCGVIVGMATKRRPRSKPVLGARRLFRATASPAFRRSAHRGIWKSAAPILRERSRLSRGLSNRAGRQYVGSERRRSRESRSANGAMLAPSQGWLS